MSILHTWPTWLAIIVIGGWALLAIAGMAYSLYLSHHYLDAIKEALKNSRYMYIWGPSLGRRGLIWSLLEMSKISGMILMPRASLRGGELDPSDLESFPLYLKLRLKIMTMSMWGSGVWLAVVCAVIKGS